MPLRGRDSLPISNNADLKNGMLSTLKLLVCFAFATLAGCRDRPVDARAISDHLGNETPLVKLQSFISPDQQFRATVCFKYDNPRFDDSFWTFLVIAKITEEDDPRRAGIQLVRLRGSTAIWCTWKSANLLEITYSGLVVGYRYSEGGEKTNEWNGVKIEYNELKKGEPNKSSITQRP